MKCKISATEMSSGIIWIYRPHFFESDCSSSWVSEITYAISDISLSELNISSRSNYEILIIDNFSSNILEPLIIFRIFIIIYPDKDFSF
jgi:hypothetical protein